MNKIFLDANILLDFLDADRAFHQAAVDRLSSLVDRGAGLVITEDLITTVYYVAKDKPRVLEFLHYILCNWEIIAFGPQVISDALAHCRANPAADLEDVLQALAARSHGCTSVLTRDRKFPDLGVVVEILT